jgi:hypothetical protein
LFLSVKIAAKRIRSVDCEEMSAMLRFPNELRRAQSSTASRCVFGIKPQLWEIHNSTIAFVKPLEK